MVRILVCVLVVLCVLFPARVILAAGLFVDAAGEVSFLLSAQNRALTGRLARSEGAGPDASLYLLDATFPVRSYALVELNIPFIAIEQKDVERGLGDVTLRARTQLFAQPHRKLYLLSSLRTGSGTTRVYPYSSQSIDLEAGLGYVDTTGSFDLWVSATSAYVSKEPVSYPKEKLHGDFTRLGVGLGFNPRTSVRAGAGAMILFFGDERTRQLLLVSLEYYRSRWLVLNLTGHMENGENETRVGDYAITAGIRVNY